MSDPLNAPASPSPDPVGGGGGSIARPASLALAVALAGAGVCCIILAVRDPWGRKEALVGSITTPVVFVLSPDHADKCGEDGLRELSRFLEERTGFAVEVKAAKSPVEGIDAFGGTADVGILPLFQYLLARSEYGAEAGLLALRRDGQEMFDGVLVVRAQGGPTKLAELAGRTVAFKDAYSTSGFVFPMKRLADAGIRVQVEFEKTHAQVLARLREGKAAAGATYADQVADDPAFRILARTDPIPNEPVIFRKGFAADKRDRICAALEYLGQEEQGKKLLAKMADITGFRRVTDDHYLEVLATVTAAGKTLYDVVPEGLSVDTRRRYLELAPR